jgi:hypothetical protein
LAGDAPFFLKFLNFQGGEMKKIACISFLAVFCIYTTIATAADKVVVIPLGSSALGTDKLLGKGRPGTSLMTHTDPNGYCTTSAGIKHALSFHFATWGEAAEVCPAGTWVCSSSDLPTTGSCPILPLTTYRAIDCSGVKIPASPVDMSVLIGWESDASLNEADGIVRISSTWGGFESVETCVSFRVWCCWK